MKNKKVTPIKIHNELLKTLQEVYILKAKIINNEDHELTDITNDFNEVNFYANGQGYTVIEKMNKLFKLEKVNEFINDSGSKLNQLINTSLHDSLYLTCIKQLKILKKELKEIIDCLEMKKQEYNEKEKRITKNLRIDETLHLFFDTYIHSLVKFDEKIDYLVKNLENNLPLSSSLVTDNEVLKDYSNKIHLKENDEKLFESIKSSFNLNSSFNQDANRLEKIGDFMPVKEISSTNIELGSVLMKFANDIRFLSSGPRSGFGEMIIPENEPGSSIMPGKVNPTQCESMTMVCSQVLASTNSIMIASSSSMFEGSIFLPLISNNIVRSIVLLSDGIRSFRTKCLIGAEFIKVKIEEDIKNFKI